MNTPAPNTEIVHVGVIESMVHYLAYANLKEQVDSMVLLLTERNVSLAKDESLMFRLTLCEVFDRLSKKVVSCKDLENALFQLDELFSNTTAIGSWAEHRLHFVSQLIITLLKHEAGINNARGDMIIPRTLAKLNPVNWSSNVHYTFRSLGYDVDDQDGEAETQQQMMDFELEKEMESLVDIGAPDKVHVAYLFKKYPYADFLDRLQKFFKTVQDEICGLPELLRRGSQHARPARPAHMVERRPFPKLLDSVVEMRSPMRVEEPQHKRVVVETRHQPNRNYDEEAPHEQYTPYEPSIRPFEDNNAFAENYLDDDGDCINFESSTSAQGHLKKATKVLTSRCDDHLALALADTSPNQRSVLADHGSPLTQKNRGVKRTIQDRGGKPEPFIGVRDTSTTVQFTPDSGELSDEFDEVPSLPKHAIQSIKPMPKYHAMPSLARQQPAVKKGRRQWTQEEETWLMEGVAEFGLGKWANIKKKYFSDTTRSSVDIKDKYRNMNK